MSIHAQTSITGQPHVQDSSILHRLERLLARDPDARLPRDLLGRERLWKKLSPADAQRWAVLAQAAGLMDLSLQVLSWINATQPDHGPAWRARLDLLQTLGRSSEARDLAARHADRLGPGASAAVTAADGGRREPGPGAGSRTDAPEPGSAPGTSRRDADIDAPFHAMRREEELLARFLQLFQGREDCFARQWADRKAGTRGYVPVRRPMTAADVRDHVRGLRTYGIYILQQDSRVRLAVVDADLAARLRGGSLSAADRDLARREKSYLLERLPESARRAGLPCLVEFSGGKGFHFWFFLAGPVPAASARQALQRLTRPLEPDLSCFTLEVFPKQDQLAGKGLGNLVKLPLGLHRGTGKRSFLVDVADRSVDAQLAALEKVEVIPPERVTAPDAPVHKGRVVPHPSVRSWAEPFPELGLLAGACAALGQILAGCHRSRELSVREEKILLGTLGFLPRGRAILHRVLQALPDYSPHLVDYKLSRLRGTPLGCRRIHSLLNLTRDPCSLPDRGGYAHPLLHWPQWSDDMGSPRAERMESLEDALENLRVAIGTVQRFLGTGGRRAST
ncbi:MAG: CRISPR-associated primase-polymerase type A1 [Syntrophobacteraceae bacterium]|jgi:hypothetical protein|nr:CRISPR-associated primase-polymerase type A1 [Syntrophobacteraceae bacterium]